MQIEHIFLYEPKPEHPLAIAYLPDAPWDLIRTEVNGRGYDLDTGEPIAVFTHFIRPKE